LGVVLWYQVQLPTAGTTVSNDVLSGDYILDAQISVTYGIGQIGTFEVTLTGLPKTVSDALSSQLLNGPGGEAAPGITIRLGYFDLPQGTVLIGRIQTVDCSFLRNRPVTVLKGSEEAGFKLANARNPGPKPAPLSYDSQPGMTTDQIVRDIVSGTGVSEVAGLITPVLTFDKVHIVANDAWGVLQEFAKRNDAELMVQDGKLYFGQSIVDGGVPSAPPSLVDLLSADDRLVLVNTLGAAPLARFEPRMFKLFAPGPTATDLPTQATVGAFDFTTAGLPEMRPGQLVVASVADYAEPFDAFRIANVTHIFGPASGYTCAGRAIKFLTTGSNRAQTIAGLKASAQSVADIVNGRIVDGQVQNPSIDVGRVKDSKPVDRLASVYYRQDFAPTKAAPSVDVDVLTTNPTLTDKPLASPFAFDGVGLVVPVYPGMRALLAQNRSSRQDAIIAGFLWANEPNMARPPAQQGDWWLCLPTGLDGQGMPTGPTANDITAADGLRAVEAKGLLLKVGQGTLTSLGTRPPLGNADELLIQHSSGTTVKIASGGDFEVKNQNITLTVTNSELSVSSGSVTFKVGSSSVEIS